MPISIANTSYRNLTPSTNNNYAYNHIGDTLIIAAIASDGGGKPTVSTITFNGNVPDVSVYTNQTGHNSTTGCSLYVWKNVNTVNANIVMNFSRTAYGGIWAVSLSGANKTNPVDANNFLTSTGTSANLTISGADAGSIVLDFIGIQNNVTTSLAETAGQTEWMTPTFSGAWTTQSASSEAANGTVSTGWSWTGSQGYSIMGVAIAQEPTEPTIYTVANTNTIYANSSNVVISGTLLANGTSAKLVYANQEIAVLNYTANATQPYFTSPSLANVYASRIQFTNSANLQILNATSSIIASKIVTFIPSPTEKLVHDVTDISQAGNTGSIYYGLVPAITVGDQLIYDTRTSSSYNVFIDSQGFIVIDSLNTDANDSFTYRVYESSSQFWGDEATITFIGEPASPAGPTYFSKKIKMYIRVVSDAFQETFESYSTIADAINGPWDSQDTALGGTHAITTFDGSKRYACTWTQNESRTLLYYRFPGAVNGDDSTGKSYVKLEWDEYRDANWDFQADKSCRFVGRLGNGNVTLDILLGLEGSGTPGNSTRAVVFGQGLANGSTFIVDTDWNMNREQWYRIAVEIQLNTVGNSDGWIKLWRDGVLMGSTSNTNLRLGSNTYTFHQVAVGGWESGGAPAASETRYIDNVTITYL